MDVSLLYSKHRHLSAIHVAVFMVVRTRIQFQYNVLRPI